jgi:tetratricopeptide (TPR) repeat protein
MKHARSIPARPPASGRGLDPRVSALVAAARRLREAGRAGEAVAPMAQAVRFCPDNADLFHDFGRTYLDAGHPAAAVAAFKRALTLRPRFPEAAWSLGTAHETRGDLASAERGYRAALEMRPSMAGPRFRLARLYEELGRYQEAIAAYRKTKSSEPNTVLGRAAEARALLLEGRDNDLARVLSRAIALEPKDALAHELMGGVLSNAGRFDEAASSFERALREAPDMVGAYYDLVRCRRITPQDEPLIARMRAATRLPGLDSGRLSKLLLAIGKAMDDLGDYPEAMRAFDAAHAARQRNSTFDLARFEARIDSIVARFASETIASAASVGVDDPTPVLILGLPRSGTTLCEQIVSSHPLAAGGDELTFWNERGAMMEEAGALEPGFVAKAGADYLALIRPIGPTAARITDKLPFNFLWAGLIHLAFPRATIIHCRRKLIDTTLSIHQTFFADRLPFPTGGEDLVGYCRAYERLMAHWRRVLPPDRFIEIDYEGLIDEPEPVIRRMIDAAGLPWDPACLHPERNDRVVKTASKWQARQPIYRTAVDRWRLYEPFLGPLAALV